MSPAAAQPLKKCNCKFGINFRLDSLPIPVDVGVGDDGPIGLSAGHHEGLVVDGGQAEILTEVCT